MRDIRRGIWRNKHPAPTTCGVKQGFQPHNPADDKCLEQFKRGAIYMLSGDLAKPTVCAKMACANRVCLVPATLNPKQLETEEMNRIMGLCKRACAAEGGIGDMPGLVEEVSVDYLRTMNKIVLEAQTKEVRNRMFGIWSAILRVISRTTNIVTS